MKNVTRPRSWNRTASGFVTLIALVAGALISSPAASAQQGEPTVFVVRAPAEAVGRVTEAGAITLLSIDENGSTAGTRVIHQGTPGVVGGNEPGDRFGSVTAWGDVDGNGVADLIVGSPTEDIGRRVDAGAITVLYDAADGNFSRSVFLYQGSRGVPSANESGDNWGASLASGDLNGDSYDDVLVGAPLEDIGRNVDTGAVTVLYGGPNGLTGAGAKTIHQNSPGVPGVNESGDQFGFSVAVSGSGASMLAFVGAPFEDLLGVTNAGAVAVFTTDSGDLEPASPLFYAGAAESGLRPELQFSPKTDDRFGFRLVGTPEGRVAIGAPFADVEGRADAGYVMHIDYRQFDDPAVFGLTQFAASQIETGNLFGYSIDMQRSVNGFALAVGAPRDGIAGQAQAGSVTVMVSGRGGFGFEYFHQDSFLVPDQAEAYDFFGSSVDLLADGRLFVGTPGEDVGSRVDAGAGTIIEGQLLLIAGWQSVQQAHQGTPGIAGANESGDFWGS